MWYYQDNDRANRTEIHVDLDFNVFSEFLIEELYGKTVLSFIVKVDDEERRVYAFVKKINNTASCRFYETECGYLFCIEMYGARGYFHKPRKKKWWQRLF